LAKPALNVANLPVYVYKETGVKSDTQGVSNLTPQTATIVTREPHAMLPKSVVRDRELGDGAVRVYGELGVKGHGAREVEMDYGEMAENLGISESTAKRGIARLVARQHVRVTHRNNRPNIYTLLSSVFAEGATLMPVEGQRMATPKPEPLKPCLRCKRPCRRLSRNAGWCRGCVDDVEFRAKVRMLRTKYPEASERELAIIIKQECGLQRMTARVRKALREEFGG
jgi:hypothetical protein